VNTVTKNGPWKWIGYGRDKDRLVDADDRPVLVPVSGWDKADLGIRLGDWNDPTTGDDVREAIERLPQLLAIEASAKTLVEQLAKIEFNGAGWVEDGSGTFEGLVSNLSEVLGITEVKTS